jgi:hypothetical protein
MTSRWWRTASQSRVLRGQIRRAIHCLVRFCKVVIKDGLTIGLRNAIFNLNRLKSRHFYVSVSIRYGLYLSSQFLSSEHPSLPPSFQASSTLCQVMVQNDIKAESNTVDIVVCRAVARQRQGNKQLYNSRCQVIAETDARNNRTVGSGVLCAVRAEAIEQGAAANTRESWDGNENSRRLIWDGRQPGN